ncbi:hypothetical protein [Dyadobacter alkalitolerans]|uniref:hypothetical protein n=1 Tax=Dyadobacter alkalitolerans TaxID=492736 RepID=UPI0012F9C129|nr:hypothetical protein [Dyadobacter alkalitolerans]
MAQIKSFAAPHKGLRNVIARFTLFLGSIDFVNPCQLRQLKDLGHEMFTLLNHHAHSENEHTLKHLEERAKGASEHDSRDHQRLELIQQALQQQLLGFTGNESWDEIHLFYLNASRFQSQYLEHIFEEETVTELLLQQHFTDEELIEHRISLMRSFEFPLLLLWLKYIIPAQREAENVGMLSGLKATASNEAFEQIMTTIKGEMDTERFQALHSKVNGS